MNRKIGLLWIALVCAAVAAWEAPANTWYVSLDGDDSNGQTWPTAYRTISNAVVRANINMGDVVVVSNGEYLLSATISVTNGITVRGFGGRDATFINGGGVTRCFYLTAGGTIDGLTISNGYTPYNGGGLYITNGSVAIINSTISANIASDYGGGICLTGAVSCLISNCVISGNRSTASNKDGGGIYVDITNALIVDCVISNNTTGSVGGGVAFNKSGLTNLINCKIIGNTAVNGAGIYSAATQPAGNELARNCLIVSNIGTGIGGAWIQGGTLSSCTIARNSGPGGAGIGGLRLSTGIVVNCIIYGNIGGIVNRYDIYNDTSGLTNNYFNCCYGVIPNYPPNSANGNIVENPRFVNTNTVNYRLAPNSPCINAGINEDWMSTAMDLLGRRTRIYYGRVDLGCYEYFLDVKINGLPIDRIKRVNGVDKNRIFRIYP